MDFQTNPVLAKLKNLDSPPVTLHGYIGDVSDTSLSLYEQLDSSSYLVVPRAAIAHSAVVSSDDRGERVTLYIERSAKLCRITKTCFDAGQLDEHQDCGCPKPQKPGGDIHRTRDENIADLIRLARDLLWWGIDSLQCNRTGVDTAVKGCCIEFNRLLTDIKNGGNGIYHAGNIVDACYMGG